MSAKPVQAVSLRRLRTVFRGLTRPLLLSVLACASLSVSFAEADQALSRLSGADQQVVLERLLAELPSEPTAEQLGNQLPGALCA